MKFGSDEIFSLIETNIDDSENYLWYDELFSCIKSDAELLLRKDGMAYADIEDVVQEVQIAVSRNLVSYVESSKDKTEIQRNAWLKTIIKNKETDFFRKMVRTQADSLDGIDLEVPDPFDTSEKVINRMMFFEAIKKLCKIKSSPERILAFLLNKISSISNDTNGGPGIIAEEYNGMNLQCVYDCVMNQLSHIMQTDVPNDTADELWNIVEPFKDKLFSLNARTITDSSSWITGKMKKGR